MGWPCRTAKQQLEACWLSLHSLLMHMIVPPAPTLLSPPAQCQCCTNRTLVLEDVCLEHSAGLLSLLRAGGAAGGTLESLHFEQCHLVAAGLAPPAGDAGEEQEQALEELAFLVVKEC